MRERERERMEERQLPLHLHVRIIGCTCMLVCAYMHRCVDKRAYASQHVYVCGVRMLVCGGGGGGGRCLVLCGRISYGGGRYDGGEW